METPFFRKLNILSLLGVFSGSSAGPTSQLKAKLHRSIEKIHELCSTEDFWVRTKEIFNKFHNFLITLFGLPDLFFAYQLRVPFKVRGFRLKTASSVPESLPLRNPLENRSLISKKRKNHNLKIQVQVQVRTPSRAD
jgi:hypothetical protein